MQRADISFNFNAQILGQVSRQFSDNCIGNYFSDIQQPSRTPFQLYDSCTTGYWTQKNIIRQQSERELQQIFQSLVFRKCQDQKEVYSRIDTEVRSLQIRLSIRTLHHEERLQLHNRLFPQYLCLWLQWRSLHQSFSLGFCLDGVERLRLLRKNLQISREYFEEVNWRFQTYFQ